MFHKFRNLPSNREAHLQRLWRMRQTWSRQAEAVYCADNTARGREIHNDMKEDVRALDWAIDELDTEGAVRKETA